MDIVLKINVESVQLGEESLWAKNGSEDCMHPYDKEQLSALAKGS
jgi:hypothetical protein